MIELHITPAFILAIISMATFAIGVVGWFIRLERRFNTVLTKEEHKDICDDKQEAILEKIRELKQEVKAANEYSSTQRHAMRATLQSIEIKLASKLGDM